MLFLFLILLAPPTEPSPIPIGVDLAFPVDIALHDGLLYVVDFQAHTAWALDPATGQPIRQFGRYGQGPGEIIHPEKALWSEGRLWLFSHETKTIVAFDPDTGVYVDTIRVACPGFAAGVWRNRLILAGTSPGHYDAKADLVSLAPLIHSVRGRAAQCLRPGDPRRQTYIQPSSLLRRARGWVQQHVALWAPERAALFYGDPLDFATLRRIDLETGRVARIALPAGGLAHWDGRQPIQKAVPTLDLYHVAGHGHLETPAGDFVFVTWRRAAGDFFTAFLDLEAEAPAGTLEGAAFPVGAHEGRMVFFHPDGSLLLQPLAEVFLEAVGRNPYPRGDTRQPTTL